MKPTVLSDDFTKYFNFTKDTQSNDIWYCHYLSNGKASTLFIDSKHTMSLKPEYVENQTRSCLVTTNQCFSDFILDVDMKTLSQNRPMPKNWETAWLLFNYYDDWHHYFLLLHADGSFELGRKDYDTQIEQEIYLVTKNFNISPFKWNNMRILKTNNHITVFINGIKYVDIIDDGSFGTDSDTGKKPAPPSAKLKHGNIGLYCEDCNALYSNFSVIQL